MVSGCQGQADLKVMSDSHKNHNFGMERECASGQAASNHGCVCHRMILRYNSISRIYPEQLVSQSVTINKQGCFVIQGCSSRRRVGEGEMAGTRG